MIQPYFAVITAFDQANAADPACQTDAGREYPAELLYAMRMTEMLERFAPDASEAVRLAVRAQHICRWKIPRSDFPMDRQGYLQWRTRLYVFHADTACALMREAGYDEEMIRLVGAIISKQDIKVNADAQLLEDIAALVFFAHSMHEFVDRHPEYDESKWIRIILKTWQKISPAARDFVLSGQIALPAQLRSLIHKAVQD